MGRHDSGDFSSRLSRRRSRTPGLGPYAAHLAELSRRALAGQRDLRYDSRYDMRA